MSISGVHASLPSRTEIVNPRRNETFDKNGRARKRKQGGNPRIIAKCLAFSGSMDGNRQVDPQIAVGGGYVLHATNNGLIIYDKKGNYVNGIRQSCFNGGIDPKLFFCVNNKVFGFDFWDPWDNAKNKPVNISVSETSDPNGAWNTYPVSIPNGRDGGGIGHSTKWIGYSFPGGPEQTFVLKMSEAKAGLPVTIYHFKDNLGQPAFNQDDNEILYFLKITSKNFILSLVKDSGDGTPVTEQIIKPHNLTYIRFPPNSPQKGTSIKTASGDRNPKNLVLQGGFLWFSHTVNHKGRSAVQWHQLRLDGSIVQSGLIANPHSNYIQTTLAVNKRNDLLIGFQETNKNMFISPRMTLRLANDPPGMTRKIISLGEGQGATSGTAWGDYSGSVIDGDNLLDLWTIQSITDKLGKGDTIIVKVPYRRKNRQQSASRQKNLHLKPPENRD
jgi:hypothetical protein